MSIFLGRKVLAVKESNKLWAINSIIRDVIFAQKWACRPIIIKIEDNDFQ